MESHFCLRLYEMLCLHHNSAVLNECVDDDIEPDFCSDFREQEETAFEGANEDCNNCQAILGQPKVHLSRVRRHLRNLLGLCAHFPIGVPTP